MYNEFEEYDLKTKLNHKIWLRILKEMLRYPWYLIGAIVLMISTLIIKQKIYYYIFISLLLALSLICKFKPRFMELRKSKKID